MVCAGNLESDGAIVEEMSTAMQSRLAHIILDTDIEGFLDWAMAGNIDRRITSYIQYRPGNLYAFNPEHTDFTFACNRTWEFAHKVLRVTDDSDPDRLPMLAGVISEGVAREFSGFLQIDTQLPKLHDIKMSPDTVLVPDEPSILFMLTGAIAEQVNDQSAEPLIKYVSRLPTEFQFVCIKETVRRNKASLQLPAVQKWVAESGKALF
jgi:hypothetical protein